VREVDYLTRIRERRQAMSNVWSSLVTSEMVKDLNESEISLLVEALNDSVMEICQNYAIEGK
jgi:hypothetical protein